MKKSYLLWQLTNRARILFKQPGLAHLKLGFRYLQARSRRLEFEQMQQLATRPELAPLLAEQPHFQYKHLSSYAATGFSRSARLAAIRHHYQLLETVAAPDFIGQVAQKPIIWRETLGEQHYAVTLSYPHKAHFEGELSLHFYQGTTLLQMLTWVLVPGWLLGLAAPHVLLITQVQGTPDVAALRQATKLLGDITPANLLVNAAYGLAAAFDVSCVAGTSSYEQLGRGHECHFDYDGFWEQFRGRRLPTHFYLLDPENSERPIEDIKAKYRPRTLRKRAFKHQLRRTVEATVRAYFCPAAQAAPARAYCEAG